MNSEKKIWLRIKPHHHIILSDSRASLYSQLFGEEQTVRDDRLTAKARALYEAQPSAATAISLCKALSGQLRYREGIEVIEGVAREDTVAKRKLAMLYMKTGKFAQSLEAFLELSNVWEDELDIEYRLGLCAFYLGRYEESYNYMDSALKLCHGNEDMYLACLYWCVLCLVRSGKDVGKATHKYYEIFSTHHAGYEYAIRLFLGDKPQEYEQISKSDNLTRIMYLYGLYHYYMWKSESAEAEKTYAMAKDCQEFWASFSGLALWAEELRKQEKR